MTGKIIATHPQKNMLEVRLQTGTVVRIKLKRGLDARDFFCGDEINLEDV